MDWRVACCLPVVGPVDGGAGVGEPVAYGGEGCDFRLDYCPVACSNVTMIRYRAENSTPFFKHNKILQYVPVGPMSTADADKKIIR